MPFFKVTTAPGHPDPDTVYLQAEHLGGAKAKMEAVMGPIPPRLLRWQEVPEAQVPRTEEGKLDLLAPPLTGPPVRRRRP